MGLFLSLLLLVGLSPVLTSCAKKVVSAERSQPTTKINMEKQTSTPRLLDRDIPLAKRLIAQENAVVLDVRSQKEWDQARYDGALLVPHTELAARMDEVVRAAGGDLNRPVVIYCRSGRRADLARSVLETQGFTRVTNAGGLVDLCPECVP